MCFKFFKIILFNFVLFDVPYKSLGFFFFANFDKIMFHYL